jgi:hypothetical protein
MRKGQVPAEMEATALAMPTSLPRKSKNREGNPILIAFSVEERIHSSISHCASYSPEKSMVDAATSSQSEFRSSPSRASFVIGVRMLELLSFRNASTWP